MECIVWQIGIAGVANACSVNTISLIHREMAMRKFIGDKITHDLQSAVTGVVGAWDVVAAVPNEKLAAESIDLVKLSIDTAKASVEDFVVALRVCQFLCTLCSLNEATTSNLRHVAACNRLYTAACECSKADALLERHPR
jgi:hypothetical protein